MRHAISFLIGGLATFVALDLVPAATQHVSGVKTTAPVPGVMVTVNRARKGDRTPALKMEQARDRKESPAKKVLEGCDPSFSPVTSPSLAHVTGRCMV